MELIKYKGKEFTLGVHFESHDTGASLVNEKGEIIAAVNEERLTRRKEEDATPINSIKAIFEMTGLNAEDISSLALSGSAPGVRKDIQDWKTYGAELIQSPFTLSSYFLSHVPQKYKESELGRNLRNKKKDILNYLQGFKGKINHIDHHLCHASSAYFTSGKDDVLCLTFDGMGDFKTSTVYTCHDGKLNLVDSTPWPHSAGSFYKLITEILGFRPRRHAGKITGLAAYGNPSVADSVVSKLITSKGLQLRVSNKLFEYKWHYRKYGKIHPELAKFSREDLSAAFQNNLEKVATEIVSRAVKMTGIRDVVLAGGVTANVKLNQRIRELPEVNSVFIHPSMGDGGLATGAALYSWSRNSFTKKIPSLDNVYLGPSYSDDEIENAMKEFGVKWEKLKNTDNFTAEMIENKKIVGRFSGRMEYGPRALGNRSILADPTDKTINDWLNERLKRTEFMPFAPSTIKEDGKRYYKGFSTDHKAAEFMTITYDVTDEAAKTAPAVTHVDKTARPQAVSEDTNSSYYKILQHYKKLTGISCFINTSFNMHEEPIICSPSDAIRAFKQGSVDILTLGNYVIIK